MNNEEMKLKMCALKFGVNQTSALLEGMAANPSEWDNDELLTLYVNLRAAYMIAEDIFNGLNDENRDKR